MEYTNGAVERFPYSNEFAIRNKFPPAATEKEHYKNGDSKSTFSVAKFDMVRLLPNVKIPAPNGLYMLSNLDQIVPYPIEILFSFQTKTTHVDFGEVLKQSLSKVMEEYYYPLAGSLKLGCDGKMVVDCGGGDGGVQFVETVSDEEMAAAVGDITTIDQKLARKLVYSNHRPYDTILDIPPLAIQVTRFKCGGMILGVRFNHVIMDGIGFTDFMQSWTEIARGIPLSNKPHLDRSILSPRNPPKIQFPHPEYSKIERPLTPQLTPNQIIVTKSFSFTPSNLSHLRNLATQNNNNRNDSVSPTTLELISALVWICWTNAKKVGQEISAQIVTAVDGRHKLRPPMPKGYFGNGVVWSCARSRARELTRRPFAYAVGLVRDALKEVTEDYVRSTVDFHEATRKPLELGNTLWITKWSRLPLYEIDFGWGAAAQVAPGSVLENLVVLLSHGKDSKDVVIALTLPVEAMEIFQELIRNYIN